MNESVCLCSAGKLISLEAFECEVSSNMQENLLNNCTATSLNQLPWAAETGGGNANRTRSQTEKHNTGVSEMCLWEGLACCILAD